MKRKPPIRRKAPKRAAQLAARIKEAGGIHAHLVVTGWRLVFADETHRCGTDQCFVMRLKGVELAPGETE